MQFFERSRPLLLGHRGAAGERPENTLCSFRRALEVGAEAIETDLRLTRDRVVVCLHDETVDRTTDGRGEIAALGIAEVRRLDAADRFSPDGGRTFPYRGTGVGIPTLEDLLAALPTALLNLELKSPDRALARGAVDAVRTSGATSRVLFSSFHEEALEHVRREGARLDLPLAIGLAAESSRRFVEAATRGEPPPAPCLVLQVPSHVDGRSVPTGPLVSYAHAHGARVFVWTVNDAAEAAALLDLGVDGIVSDVPGRLSPLFGTRA